MRLRTAATAVVYRKSLKLSSASKRMATTGEICNLMSVDAQKLQDAPGYIHMLWSTPLTIALAIYFLWQQLGPSVLAGLAVMILLVPVNGAIAQKTRKLQISQMRFKDSRVKLINEILNGIKVLKLYAWERAFKEQVNEIRGIEMKLLKTSQFLSAGSSLSWFMAPYMVSLGTFAVYVLSSPNNILDANKAFVSLSLFNILQYPLSILPAVLSYLVQGAVSIGRISRFLKNEELNPDGVTHNPSAGKAAHYPVSIESGTFTWDKSETPTLRNINLRVPHGQLVGVVGQVGSGKSSLISAILGDMEILEGSVNQAGSMAYVPQQAWIQNGTVQENIMFSKTLFQPTYDDIIDACALTPDLKILAGGDQTEIGGKGINLSGGQKQRVSLARSVYQDCDVYLLDDPLSAVDAHVGKHIFERVIGPTGLLKHKTRILVTNSITYLSQMDQIVVMRNGEVSEIGTYQELVDRRGAFAEFIAPFLVSHGNDGSSDEDDEGQFFGVCFHFGLYLSFLLRPRRLGQNLSRAQSILDEQEKLKKEEQTKQQMKLTEEELAKSGNVRLKDFLSYFKAYGGCLFTSTMWWYLMYLATQTGSNIWLSMWSNDPPSANGTQDTQLRDLRLGVYGGLGLIQAIGVIGQSFSAAVGCVAASRALHHNLLNNILRAPMSFFDTTPLGRIVNRFARDIDVVDVNIPITLRIWLGTFAGVVSTLFVISFSTPVFLAVVIPLGIFYYFVQRFYIASSRQLRRIDSILRSPIYTHFEASLTGASSIRAYDQSKRFIQHSDYLLDKNQMAYYPYFTSNRWLSFWLETVGNLIVLFAAIFATVEKDNITAGLAGLSVSYALQVTGALNMVVRMTSDMETYIVGVERINEYANCPKEAPEKVDMGRSLSHWPEQGRVELKNFSTRYRQGLNLVLNNVSVVINPMEKVGIVGRTGAGKSSLTLALFRILESTGGDIIIDDINIGHLGLTQLRSRLTIIPQDPVLFSGTLRLNLDPFSIFTDEEIWNSLSQAHLRGFVDSLPAGLSAAIAEGGGNLSVGQRQLVCLARALLRRTKILVLDEATAAIDLETDELIQSTIRTEFKDCTVITIAHRLNTIMDYDKIIILDQGQIVEHDSPENLLQNPSSLFYRMAKDAHLV
ncbi:hypothetical protein CAPTEDRAFT_158862 [Capitella teleta]|uniref:ABC-type glutathione-S-conjugate transporter n=1 Tax=Capitella teleta TaxID=283909 RepID=R7U9W4_CAPTE|nr:hypothetical protein CAPTEDRAFT_158862 [Capitella teleta]|eukprot:ELT99905.1 hypothetical protein CAPTEDRAFT_158862 [Capitella teleta]